MKRFLLISLICSLLAGLPAYGSEEKLPIIDGKPVVAAVNDEPITLEEFNRAIGAAHAARSGEKAAGHIDYSNIMNRLINTRLIIIEGRNMGLDELPGVRDSVDAYSKQTLMELVIEKHVGDLYPDEKQIDKIYREMVKEWRITSVWFETEEAARKFQEIMKGGKSFEEAVKLAVEKGITKDITQSKYFKDRDLNIPVAQLISKMEIGSVSPPVSFDKKGFIIFKLEDVRIPEDEDLEARKTAEAQARNQLRVQAAKAYYQDLEKKYVRVDENLLAALNYEAKEPGMAKLLEDDRVIAEVQGEKPITVAELSKALKEKFYHGIQLATESKSVNERKAEVLDDVVQKRILVKEALKQGLNETEEYTYRVKEYENSVIFGLFIKKVIAPDIKLDAKELETYYKDNSEEYKSPEMMRIKELVFHRKADAVDALNKLVGGTDFAWLSSRAEGQVDKGSQGLLEFAGKLLTVRSLPEGVRKSLSGANPGEFRLYESPEGYYYVLYIYDLIPAELQPFEQVKKAIAKKVFDLKVKKALEDYAAKLKEYYPVKIYAKHLQ
jgi:hypothetical protein